MYKRDFYSHVFANPVRYISSRFFENQPNEICCRLSEKGSLKFIRLLRDVFSSQQRLNRLAVNAVQCMTTLTTRKPGSDFDWLIV